jgi:hypothetical protein
MPELPKSLSVFRENCQGGGYGLAFCRQVFVVLGLLREKANEYVPTRFIQNLIFKN